jgi:hypothetical protein
MFPTDQGPPGIIQRITIQIISIHQKKICSTQTGNRTR